MYVKLCSKQRPLGHWVQLGVHFILKQFPQKLQHCIIPNQLLRGVLRVVLFCALCDHPLS